MAQEHVGEPLALPRRENGKLVQIGGGSIGDLGPEGGIARLKPEHSHRFRALESKVIEAVIDVWRDCGLTHFRGGPKLKASFAQIGSSSGE